MEKLTHCPICQSTQLASALTSTDYSLTREEFAIVRCTSCGFMFTNPRPSEHEVGPYYEFADYVSHSDENGGLLNQVYRLARRYAVGKKIHLIDGLATTAHLPRTLLDYGCGSGFFLSYAAEKGWQTNGIEPSESARETANKRLAQPAVLADILNLPEDKRFSVITLWHVLEHVHRLHETVDELLNRLAPAGRLVIAVPNAASADARHYGSAWAAYDVPRHLYHFVPETMKKLLARHGAVVEKILPMPLDAYYVSLLSERYKGGSPLGAIWTGYRSNRQAASSGQYSSLIYIISRAENA